MPDYRLFTPGVILFAGCALLWKAHTQAAVPLEKPLQSVLADVPGLRLTDQILSDEERRVAGMTDYVARSYLRDGVLEFATFVSYYDRQTQGKTIHSPRNCLPGAGWEIMRAGTHTLADGATVNRYVLRNGTATALVYYWYQGRGRVTANEYAVKWNLLRDAALSGRTEEALVRIVVPVAAATAVASEDEAMRAADATAQAIALRLVREVNGVLPGDRGRRT